MRFTLNTIFLLTLFVNIYSQTGYLSEDTSKYSPELTQYCLSKDQKDLNTLQKNNIELLSFWAKKIYTKETKGHFHIFVQSCIDMSAKDREYFFKMVRMELLANGVHKKRIKLEATFPNSALVNFKGTCNSDVVLLIFPEVKKSNST